MSRLSQILRDAEDGHGGTRLMFRCPGCGDIHDVAIGTGPGPRWTYNGNPEKPTFSPSILARSGHYVQGYDGKGCWCDLYRESPPTPGKRIFKCYVCHSFVTDGRIRFLADCTHALAGQTVDLPEWDF